MLTATGSMETRQSMPINKVVKPRQEGYSTWSVCLSVCPFVRLLNEYSCKLSELKEGLPYVTLRQVHLDFAAHHLEVPLMCSLPGGCTLVLFHYQSIRCKHVTFDYFPVAWVQYSNADYHSSLGTLSSPPLSPPPLTLSPFVHLLCGACHSKLVSFCHYHMPVLVCMSECEKTHCVFCITALHRTTQIWHFSTGEGPWRQATPQTTPHFLLVFITLL